MNMKNNEYVDRVYVYWETNTFNNSYASGIDDS